MSIHTRYLPNVTRKEMESEPHFDKPEGLREWADEIWLIAADWFSFAALCIIAVALIVGGYEIARLLAK